MDKETARSKWTEEHISYLKTAYLQGSSLKKIAVRLNRSVSAINKVLARHNLRTHSKMSRLPTLSSPTTHASQKTRILDAHIRKRNMKKLKFILPECRQEVSIERVIYWLKAQNVSVTKSSKDSYYEVDGCPKNAQQILYKANVMREQQKLPVFWVKGVSHS